ncbi:MULTISPECIES: hypothetical protein [Lysobacter]|uniref:Uncharacterized protein n=1 Tax=Lysobacter firmicutimachus TaxID=1792846 RepID=A0ABU8D758_9GAMM|nr:hypothetical protein [Lysobacter antibioticus]
MKKCLALVLAILSMALVTGCTADPSQTHVVSPQFSLCIATSEPVAVSLRDGIDATQGEIRVGASRASLTVDLHPYYPGFRKIAKPERLGADLISIDSGVYETRAGGRRTMTLSAYELADRGVVYVVLAGAPGEGPMLERIRDRFCACGRC